MTDIAALLDALRRARLDLANEKRAQAMLMDHLAAQGILAEREARLSQRDIIDFMIWQQAGSGIGIELKLKGHAKITVYEQLIRYASHDAVQTIVLMTNISMGLPEEIVGKPAYYVALGRAWL